MVVTTDQSASTSVDVRLIERPSNAMPEQTGLMGRKSLLRRITSENRLAFIISLAAYLTGAVLLDFHYLSFNWDSVSRMANGFYILYSRDPHLAAVGFVLESGDLDSGTRSSAFLPPLVTYCDPRLCGWHCKCCCDGGCCVPGPMHASRMGCQSSSAADSRCVFRL